MLIIEIEKRHNKMVDRIRYPTVSYLPFYYVFFQFLLLTIFNLQANILTTKDILSNLAIKYLSQWGNMHRASLKQRNIHAFNSMYISCIFHRQGAEPETDEVCPSVGNYYGDITASMNYYRDITASMMCYKYKLLWPE